MNYMFKNILARPPSSNQFQINNKLLIKKEFGKSIEYGLSLELISKFFFYIYIYSFFIFQFMIYTINYYSY